MTLQDLYRVTTFTMGVEIFNEHSVYPWLYFRFLKDIPKSLLDCQIIVISSFEINCLLITIG